MFSYRVLGTMVAYEALNSQGVRFAYLHIHQRDTSIGYEQVCFFNWDFY
jgi:hypothetical protein